MHEAETLCSEVAVIRAGRLVAVGQPDELRSRAGAPRLEVVGRNFNERARQLLLAQPSVLTVETINGHWDIHLAQTADSSALVSLLVGAGVSVDEVRRSQASLEEVFVTLMEEEQ